MVLVLAAACGDSPSVPTAAGSKAQQPVAARPAPTRQLPFGPSAAGSQALPAQPAQPAQPDSASTPPLATTPSAAGCRELDLVADDRTFLGVGTSSQFATDGVCNEFSQYGGQFSTNGIFNEFSQYGSQFSQLSAYNEFTQTPPHLYCGRDQMNPITKNKYLPLAVDPDVLCEVLAELGY